MNSVAEYNKQAKIVVNGVEDMLPTNIDAEYYKLLKSQITTPSPIFLRALRDQTLFFDGIMVNLEQAKAIREILVKVKD